jgi:hypothetical protein
VKEYLAAGGWTPYQQPERKKALDGQETWLRERLRRHRGNADMLRQELAIEKAIAVNLRTVERAVKPYRQELEAEARKRRCVLRRRPASTCRSILANACSRSAGRSCASRRSHIRLPQRTAGELVRWAGKCVHEVWRSDQEVLFDDPSRA